MRVTAALIAIAFALIGAQAGAFVLEGPHHRPWPAQEDLNKAARWSAEPEALVGEGVRGLGGGLEYALDESVCTRLQFVDSPRCDDVKASIKEALERWSAGRDDLRFVDVSDRIGAQVQGASAPEHGIGAEIDFIAASGAEFPPFRERRIAAVTIYYFDSERRPLLTNGAREKRSLGVLTAADVRFSTETCFYLNESAQRLGCAHFPSIVQHEIAHVLGIEHPDQFPNRNLDSDNDPSTPMRFDCRDPAASLRPSDSIDQTATTIATVWGANVWRNGLTLDDIGAREALYPRCPAQGFTVIAALPGRQSRQTQFASAATSSVQPQRETTRWGAFARAQGTLMSVAGATSRAEAQRRIQEACGLLGRECETVAAFSQCFAYAEDNADPRRYFAREAETASAARIAAIEACAADGLSCTLKETFCAE